MKSSVDDRHALRTHAWPTHGPRRTPAASCCCPGEEGLRRLASGRKTAMVCFSSRVSNSSRTSSRASLPGPPIHARWGKTCTISICSARRTRSRPELSQFPTHVPTYPHTHRPPTPRRRGRAGWGAAAPGPPGSCSLQPSPPRGGAPVPAKRGWVGGGKVSRAELSCTGSEPSRDQPRHAPARGSAAPVAPAPAASAPSPPAAPDRMPLGPLVLLPPLPQVVLRRRRRRRGLGRPAQAEGRMQGWWKVAARRG